MNRLIALALKVARRRESHRISRTYLNEPVLFALVARKLAHWETPQQLAIVVTREERLCSTTS